MQSSNYRQTQPCRSCPLGEIFPGTSNPTTTPILAATQLRRMAGPGSQAHRRHHAIPGDVGASLSARHQMRMTPPTANSARGHDGRGVGLRAGGNSTAKAPRPRGARIPRPSPPSVDDLVTEPSWDYDYAGTSKQFTAAIKMWASHSTSRRGTAISGRLARKGRFATSPPRPEVLCWPCARWKTAWLSCALMVTLRCSYDGGRRGRLSSKCQSHHQHPVRRFAGNGVMIASVSISGASAVYASLDSGRNMEHGHRFATSTIYGGWYDSTTNGRIWLCGNKCFRRRSVWHSADGTNWTSKQSTGSKRQNIVGGL